MYECILSFKPMEECCCRFGFCFEPVSIPFPLLPSACPGVPQSVDEEEAEEAEIKDLRKTGLFTVVRGGVKGDTRGRTLTVAFKRTPDTPVVWRESVADVAAVSSE